MSHPGIRLRITTPGGVILESDSDFLHYAAAWSHGAADGEYKVVMQHVRDDEMLLQLEIAPLTLEDTVIPNDLSGLGDT
jgi:hypothetical protein